MMVAVAGDAGGAAALAPVLQRLRETGTAVNVYAYAQAPAVFGRHGIPCVAVQPASVAEQAERAMREPDVRGLLAATSVNECNAEHAFVAAARRHGCPSLAVLDFWSNYRARFEDGEGRLAHLPDHIAVMDAQARDEMTAAGFPPGRLVVTGQPAFAAVARSRASFTAEDRERIRASLGAAPETPLVVFLSQPLASFYAQAAVRDARPAVDEREALAAVEAALERIALRRRVGMMLAVRPHPRETSSPSEWVGGIVERRVARDGEARPLLMAADLVVGVHTALLVESCYLGCLTVSYQPGGRDHDPLPTNRLGVSKAVYEADLLEKALEDLLWDEAERSAARARLAGFLPPEDAAERVIDLTRSW